MAAARTSTRVQVIAILNLVGGFLGLILSLIGIIGLLMISSGALGGGPGQGDDMQKYMIANVAGYEAYQISQIAIGLLFDVMLIASGFGLLWYQKWARLTALVWAVLSLLNKVVVLTYTVALVMPATSAYLEGALPRLPPADREMLQMITLGGNYGGLCVLVLLSAYPVVLLCLLMSKSGKQAFEPALDGGAGRGPRDDLDAPRERDGRRDDDRFRAGGDRY